MGTGRYLFVALPGVTASLSLCEVEVFGTGLHEAACSGPCDAGYYCPAGSSWPTQRECGGPNKYCPVGSGAPLAVQSRHLFG